MTMSEWCCPVCHEIECDPDCENRSKRNVDADKQEQETITIYGREVFGICELTADYEEAENYFEHLEEVVEALVGYIEKLENAGREMYADLKLCDIHVDYESPLLEKYRALFERTEKESK